MGGKKIYVVPTKALFLSSFICFRQSFTEARCSKSLVDSFYLCVKSAHNPSVTVAFQNMHNVFSYSRFVSTSALTKPFISNDRLVNASNASVRSYMSIDRPSANPAQNRGRPNSTGKVLNHDRALIRQGINYWLQPMANRPIH